MSVIEYYNPGLRQMDTVNGSSTLLTVGPSHRWSPSVDSQTSRSLSRSRSDMDMSTLPRTRSISHSSHIISTSRSETFPRSKEEKQGGMKSLISKSSRLLSKRRTSNRLKSLDSQDNDSSLHLHKHGKEQGDGLGKSILEQVLAYSNWHHRFSMPSAHLRALQLPSLDTWRPCASQSFTIH